MRHCIEPTGNHDAFAHSYGSDMHITNSNNKPRSAHKKPWSTRNKAVPGLGIGRHGIRMKSKSKTSVL